MQIPVAARQSPLSRAQAQEVLKELGKTYPDVTFSITWIESMGDRDQKTSLRSMGKTDFFTREIDQLILQGTCRVGIHSAKDLPDPLPEGLTIAALTVGVDSSDSLVMREGETLDTLRTGAVIGTSSERREDAVRKMRLDLSFKDLRGTIEKRLSLLSTGEADGIVVAEAALIRLGLTHLNRITLPGETTQGQGQLAIVVRDDDAVMLKFFSYIDSRKEVAG